MQICREKKEYYRILERTQRGDGDITEWLAWYLGCFERAVEESNSLLSDILNKSTFWKNHSEAVISERQRRILNIYLDGYEAKLTTKNWSKLADVSPGTATRDVKDLVSKGLLSPVQGRVRDVSYLLNYVAQNVGMRDFTHSTLVCHDGHDEVILLMKLDCKRSKAPNDFAPSNLLYLMTNKKKTPLIKNILYSDLEIILSSIPPEASTTIISTT